jgi:hypothetical protein
MRPPTHLTSPSIEAKVREETLCKASLHLVWLMS